MPVVRTLRASPGCLRSQINSSRTPPFRVLTNTSVSLRRVVTDDGERAHIGCAQRLPLRESLFQSTPPRGGRHSLGRNCGDGPEPFQSTPPRGGRPCECLWPSSVRSCCFNPRSRRGRQGESRRARRGAREFQSTPPRRGRRRVTLVFASALNEFQSTPREGGDCRDQPEPRDDGWKFQSTPPRRGQLTAPVFAWCETMASLNPRPREGGDLGKTSQVAQKEWFQSTPP